ncbi:MAG: hypothetical protein MZV64_00030 [Ignavibacteriales bacterium]|nr:hypothetical protein [Ignavibacteriales bacterium]
MRQLVFLRRVARFPERGGGDRGADRSVCGLPRRRQVPARLHGEIGDPRGQADGEQQVMSLRGRSPKQSPSSRGDCLSCGFDTGEKEHSPYSTTSLATT